MKFVEVDGLQFEVMPVAQTVIKTLVDPLRNRLLPVSMLKRMANRSQSPLIQESLVRPGGWRSMNIVYQNSKPVDWMDRMAVRYNPISMATRNRRKLVTAKLTELLKSLQSEPQIQLVGIGAGPGLHLQDAVVRAAVPAKKVRISLIDLDSDAFEFGRQCAKERGLENSVEFVQGDAREIRRVLPDLSPHVVKIVGLLEYLTDEQALQLLSAMRDVILPSGRLLTHGLVDRYNSGPFLKRTFGLSHVQRTEDDVRSLLKSAGFETLSVHHTPMQIYPVLISRPA
jgi:ubiquinone/menaquinone biosynthesis C-methylase UbiE